MNQSTQGRLDELATNQQGVKFLYWVDGFKNVNSHK